MKTYSQTAAIYVSMNELAKAKDMFRQGLQMSREKARRDEIAKNLAGLGEIYIREKNYRQANIALDEAEKMYIAIGKEKEANSVRRLLDTVPTGNT